MPRFYFEKLVRDKILPRTIDDPEVLHVEYQQLEGVGRAAALIKKIHEEADEIPALEAPDADAKAELADVRAVVKALQKQWGISDEELDEIEAAKTEKNGGFDNGDYIEYVDLSDDSEWVERFRAQPDKYREE